MDSILWNHFFISRVEIFCRFWYLKRFLLFLILLSHSERRLRWIEFYRDIALKGTQWNLIKRGRYRNTARMTPKRFTTFNYRPKADQKKFWVLALLFCFVLCRTLMHFDNLLMDTKYILEADSKQISKTTSHYETSNNMPWRYPMAMAM